MGTLTPVLGTDKSHCAIVIWDFFKLTLRMNSKAFVALFFNACLLACVQGLGTLTTVAYNGALSIPLLAASAGTFGTAIAVLGVIKLAAAALLLSAGEEAAKAQTFRSRRVQRSAVDAAVTSDKDALFGLIRAMDNLECGKSLICELEAQNENELEADEALILTLFTDRKEKKQVNPASAKAEYDLAAELGLASKNQIICRQRYASCPYTSAEMMQALRNSHL